MRPSRLALVTYPFMLGTPPIAVAVALQVAPWWLILVVIAPAWYSIVGGTLHARRARRVRHAPGARTLRQHAADAALARAELAHHAAATEVEAAYAPTEPRRQRRASLPRRRARA